MTMKKKIVIVALVVCIFAMSIASATLAYFTDTEGATNTFTIGNVDIKLGAKNANNVMEEIDDDNADSLLSIQNSNVYPTQVIAKDATITNIANVAAYVAGIIEISGINALLVDDTAVKAFLTGGALNATSGYATKIVPGTDSIKVYIIANAAITKDGTVVLFEDIEVPADWGNAEMNVFAGCQIDIKAYATQTAGMDNDQDTVANDGVYAIKAAFNSEFGSIAFN